MLVAVKTIHRNLSIFRQFVHQFDSIWPRGRHTIWLSQINVLNLRNFSFIQWYRFISLSVSQRQCRFAHESQILETSPIYSFNLCQNECRLRLALKTCRCVPHFYRSKSKITWLLAIFKISIEGIKAFVFSLIFQQKKASGIQPVTLQE